MVLAGQGNTLQGERVDAVYPRTGVTMATAEKYISQLGHSGNKEEFVPWFVYMLLQAALVIFLSFKFMENVPRFAALIAGNPKAAPLFQSVEAPNLGTAAKGMPVGEGEKALADTVRNLSKLFEPSPPEAKPIKPGE
jgi:hypothetical protein